MLLIAAIIIGSLSGLGLLLYFFINTPPAQLKRIVFWSAGIVSVGIFIFLLYRLSGSFLWSWVVFLIPLIVRWRGLIQQIRRAAKTASGPANGQVSSVNTEFLEMNLNHDTGEMSGLVKKGEKKGYRVETLNLNQLLELIEESKSDAASIQLLERFLDKYFDENWRETYQSSSDRYENNNDYSSDSISRAQALKILGLVEPVTDEQIKEAHRRLILANHPDRGGSTFLATQINKAKDVLLENVK